MRMLFAALTFAAVVAGASPAVQAQQAPPAPAPMPTGTLNLNLETSHTQATFAISRFGFTTILGRFDNTSGTVVLDQANPANSSVNATIQVASLSAGDATRDEHLKSPRWFDAAQYPTIEFRSTSVRQTGPTTAEVVGNLTMHGVTQPVTLAVTMNRLGQNPATRAPAAGFTATTTLSRAAFGMAIAPQLIGDEVTVRIEALAITPPAAQ